jgi:hypothetical protein
MKNYIFETIGGHFRKNVIAFGSQGLKDFGTIALKTYYFKA